jgi:SAM-dependent methyltransferase
VKLGSAIRSYAGRLYAASERVNVANMRAQLSRATSLREVVDLGCGDGAATSALTAGLSIGRLRCVEGYEPFRAQARTRGLDALAGDLEGRLPFDDDSIDAVISNQVIEHLAETDRFVAEMFRVLRPGGLAVVSTENMASWHNVVALVLGLQPFSASNYSSRRYPLGNPFGLHAGSDSQVLDGMLHRRIFTTRALRELFDAHGFEVVDVRGSGYHPLPPAVGRIDVAHAHFVSIAAQKPARGVRSEEASRAMPEPAPMVDTRQP